MLNIVEFSRRFALPLWPWYLSGIVFLILTNVITVKIPEMASRVTDNLLLSDKSQLEYWSLVIIALGVCQIICRALSRVLIFWPGRQIEASSRKGIFEHTVRLSKVFLDNFGIGDLISRLSNDLSQLRVFFAFGMLQIFNLLFLTIFTVGQMWSKNPKLTLLCLSPVVLMVLISRVMMPRLHKYNRIQQAAIGRLTNRVTEAFVSVHLIKTNAAETSFAKLCEKEVDGVYDANIKLVIVRTLLFPLIGSLATVSQVIVLFVGGHEVLKGRLSVGDILAFSIYVGTLAFPITSIGIIISVYQRARTALERLSVIDDAKAESFEQMGDSPKEETAFITAKNLSFSYQQKGSNKREAALKNIDFSIKKGEKIGLCGPVGSGKSTLFNLLTRLFDPQKGQLFYKGQDVRSIAPEKLRAIFGYALQDPYLFSETIRNNLTFGLDPKAIEEKKILTATDQSAVLSDIEKMTEKFDTPIGEKGVRLSGGQKQRLALARQLLRDNEVWLFDDVLSAVDTTTETKVTNALFSDPRTLLLASHRPGPLERCDRVFYFDSGRLVDVAPFKTLTLKYPDIFKVALDESPKKESHV